MSKTIEFSGEEHFAAPPERVFAVLTDLDTIAATIPDLQSSERVDANTLKCVVRPGFSFLRGTLKLTLTVADVVPPTSATMHVEGQGIGMGMTVDSRLRLGPEPGGTKLAWAAEVSQLKGLVATISAALITAAADQIVRNAWQQVRAKVESSPA
ncbi:MAG TPA: carbon monoxide dehydrogenase subunit G [Pirellulales bacterium]|jgi:hypothetical protein|nr:carbon monoxide dehydrogenase subunit G [Pirellulales bacterium]